MTPVVERARRLLARPGAWIEARGIEESGTAYLVRLGREPQLRGKRFTSMRIGQPKSAKEGAFVEFSVDTRDAGPEVKP